MYVHRTLAVQEFRLKYVYFEKIFLLLKQSSKSIVLNLFICTSKPSNELYYPGNLLDSANKLRSIVNYKGNAEP